MAPKANDTQCAACASEWLDLQAKHSLLDDKVTACRESTLTPVIVCVAQRRSVLDASSARQPRLLKCSKRRPNSSAAFKASVKFEHSEKTMCSFVKVSFFRFFSRFCAHACFPLSLPDKFCLLEHYHPPPVCTTVSIHVSFMLGSG